MRGRVNNKRNLYIFVLPLSVMTVGMGNTAEIVRHIGQLVSSVGKIIVIYVVVDLAAID